MDLSYESLRGMFEGVETKIIHKAPLPPHLVPWEDPRCQLAEIDEEDEEHEEFTQARIDRRWWKFQVVAFHDGYPVNLPSNPHVPGLLGLCIVECEVVNEYTGDSCFVDVDQSDPEMVASLNKGVQYLQRMFDPAGQRFQQQMLNVVTGKPRNSATRCHVLEPQELASIHAAMAEQESRRVEPWQCAMVRTLLLGTHDPNSLMHPLKGMHVILELIVRGWTWPERFMIAKIEPLFNNPLWVRERSQDALLDVLERDYAQKKHSTKKH